MRADDIPDDPDLLDSEKSAGELPALLAVIVATGASIMYGGQQPCPRGCFRWRGNRSLV